MRVSFTYSSGRQNGCPSAPGVEPPRLRIPCDTGEVRLRGLGAGDPTIVSANIMATNLWPQAMANYMLDLDLLWRVYIRRFDLGHAFHFPKPTFGWHTLQMRHPEQANHWTWLVLAAYR